jgi:hypothetical protein
MKAISDQKGGAVIDTSDLDKIMLYLKEDMLEESQNFGLFIHNEISYFAKKMIDGVSM